MPVERLTRVILNSAEPAALAEFFAKALGFTPAQSMRNATAGRTTALMLGASRLDLNEAGAAAWPYPADVPGWNPLFQHIAIVTTNMRAAVARLSDAKGWSPISTDGPQRLPLRSGGVTAFKFRDPEGHPLELIAFPEGGAPRHWRSIASSDPCLGIDHSAISVADTQRSVAFYAGLGLAVGGQSLNTGVEQQKLDAVPDPAVDVTALTPPQAETPHVELLHYRGAFERTAPPAQTGDIAATRLVFAVADAVALATIRDRHRDRLVAPGGEKTEVLLRDPDGHLLQLESASAST